MQLTSNMPTSPEPLPFDPQALVGVRVVKRSGKPFKSGAHTATVTGVVDHPAIGLPAFTFAEDDSVVECRQCRPAQDA